MVALLLVIAAATWTYSVAAQEVKAVEVRIAERTTALPDDVLRVTEGERVELRLLSDEEGELHLHGYDIEIPLRAGETTSVVIDAKVAGRFPVTAHRFGPPQGAMHGHEVLFYLEVYPR
ncbi:MAG: hypothetical protein ACREDZ_07245 [Kiloniellales bacterium]